MGANEKKTKSKNKEKKIFLLKIASLNLNFFDRFPAVVKKN